MRLKTLLLAALLVLPCVVSAQQLGQPQAITVIDSGTACTTVAGTCATFPVFNAATIAFDVSGTWTGTLTFEGTTTGAVWRSILITKTVDASTATTTTANGTFHVANVGFVGVRLRATATVTGTAFVTATAGYFK